MNMLRRLALLGGLLLLPAAAFACPSGETCNAMSGDGTLASGGALTITKVGGKSLTLGGNLTTTGAGAITLAFPGSSATFTFPSAAATLVGSARAISAGTGLSGGGDLSADRTLSLANTAVTPGAYTNANITVDAQGRITTAANGSAGGGSGDVTGPSGGVVDNEIAAYSGTTGKIIKSSGGLTFGSLVTTTRTISAGTGLSGGGTLAADRTLALANTAVTPGSYTAANITVDAQGRITAAANGGGGGGTAFCGAAGAIQTTDGAAGCVALVPGTNVATFLATPIAGIPSTWLQAGVAAANLGFTPVPDTRTITAGTGLSGGGDLSANRTLSLAAGAAAANLGFTPVPDTRTVTGTGMLAGGGDLTTNRTLNLAAAAANTVIANATAGSAVPTAVTLPACADTGGNHLNYSSGTFSCGTSSSGGSLTTTDGTNSVANTITQTFDPVVFTVGGSAGSATITTKTTVNSQSGTTYTVIASDANKTVRTTNASAVTLNLTAAATLGSGFGFYVECDGAGGCTVDPAGAETIDGAATLAIAAGGKAFIQTDATGWRGAYMPPLNPLNASNLNAGTLAVARGGTGLANGTSGGILGYTASGTLASSGALTAGLPLIGGGAGATPTVGTRSGNTTKYVSMDASSPATNDCAKFDANGNLTTAGAACGSSSGITSANATIGWVPGVDLAKAIVLGPVAAATTVTDIRGKLIVAEGSAATIMVRKAASTEDCTAAAGADAQTTATFDLNTTAPANQNLTLVGGAANTLAAGDSLCLEVTGTTATTKGSINVTFTVP